MDENSSILSQMAVKARHRTHYQVTPRFVNLSKGNEIVDLAAKMA